MYFCAVFGRRISYDDTKMNKFLTAIFASVLLMFSCKGGKMTSDGGEAPADSVDSVEAEATDTMELLIEETPMPKAADELFDDFLFNFAANRKLQTERIVFPLPVTNGDATEYIEKDEWKMEHFFMRQGYYTLIFDSRRQMDLGKDTAVSHVVVEKIHLDIKTVKQYVFDRVNGLWMMRAINISPIYKNENASFLKFYQHFVSDSTFQIASLDETVHFVGPDPDDDFEQMEGVITPDTWPAFAPEMPDKMIYNINYGMSPGKSNIKIFVIRGISNGLEMEMTFRRKDGRWVLTRLTT